MPRRGTDVLSGLRAARRMLHAGPWLLLTVQHVPSCTLLVALSLFSK